MSNITSYTKIKVFLLNKSVILIIYISILVIDLNDLTDLDLKKALALAESRFLDLLDR